MPIPFGWYVVEYADELSDGGKQVTVRDLPQRDHIDVPVRESLIVELYSK